MLGSVWTLCYHDIEDFAQDGVLSSHCVSLQRIISDLQMLQEAGLELVSKGEDYRSLYQSGHEMERSRVLLTFDDGYSSQVESLWRLGREQGVGALLFVIVGNIGRRGFADWQGLRDLAKVGYGIQSHGYSHTVLTCMDWRSLTEEMKRSRAELQEHTGQSVWGLAIPQGFYNSTVLFAARRAGYQVVFTSRYGIGCRTHRSSGIVLANRIVAYGNRIQRAVSHAQRASLAGWWFRLVGGCQDELKNLLGYRVTSFLWKILRSCKRGTR